MSRDTLPGCVTQTTRRWEQNIIILRCQPHPSVSHLLRSGHLDSRVTIIISATWHLIFSALHRALLSSTSLNSYEINTITTQVDNSSINIQWIWSSTRICKILHDIPRIFSHDWWMISAISLHLTDNNILLTWTSWPLIPADVQCQSEMSVTIMVTMLHSHCPRPEWPNDDDYDRGIEDVLITSSHASVPHHPHLSLLIIRHKNWSSDYNSQGVLKT